jgi:opacity protein-like surface antigen
MNTLADLRFRRAVILFGILVVGPSLAGAQALLTAGRGAELSPFAQTTLLSPDWGPTNNLGYTVGLDYTRFTRSFLQPSLEARYSNAGGQTVSERSFTGGLKLQATIRGIHPYATLLAGQGGITFTHPVGNYLSDSSFVYSLGGGVEFMLRSQWSVRLDFTQQNWNLDPATLTPTAMGIGIAYRLPFHNGRAM